MALSDDFVRELNEYYEKGLNTSQLKDYFNRTALHYVIHEHVYDLIPNLISDGIDIDAQDDNGQSALHSAAEWNDLEAAQILLNFNLNINIMNRYNETPLYIAIRNDNLEIVKLLLEHNALPNIVSKFGTTLYAAVWSRGPNHIEIIKTLILYGVDIDFPTWHYSTNDYKLEENLAIREACLVRRLLHENEYTNTPDKYKQTITEHPNIINQVIDYALSHLNLPIDA